MSIVHTRTLSIRSTTGDVSGSGSSTSVTSREVGNAEVRVDEQIGAGVTNLDIPLSVAIATLQSVIIISDAAVTIKTNSTSSPGNTWTISPNRPLDWGVSTGIFANPVSANLTHLYITTSLPARVQAWFLNT